MNIHYLLSDATASHLLLGEAAEGVGLRAFMMFAAGIGTLNEMKVEKLVHRS